MTYGVGYIVWALASSWCFLRNQLWLASFFRCFTKKVDTLQFDLITLDSLYVYIYIYDIFTHLPGLVRTCDTKSSTGGAPMTARHMDSLIRLAEANARIELRHHAPLLLQPLGVASNMEKTPQLLVVDPWTPNSQLPFFRGFVSVLGSVPSPSNVKMDEKCWILACMTCLLKVKMDTVSDLGGTVLTPVWNSINLTPIGRRWNSNERADKMGSAELWLPERKLHVTSSWRFMGWMEGDVLFASFCCI